MTQSSSPQSANTPSATAGGTANSGTTASRALSSGQRAYEERRAAKAGMPLDKWLDSKQKKEAEEARKRTAAAPLKAEPRKPGLFSRLLERARKPL